MYKIFIMKSWFVWSFVLSFLVLGSCKKNGNGEQPPEDIADNAALNEEVLKTARDVYLWNDQIPEEFDAKAYKGPEEIMTAIREFSNEPGFTDPVDAFSFAMKKQEWDAISEGVATDFGLNVFFMNDGDLRVRAVEKASPAGLAGIRRGWRVVKVAGSTDMNISNASFIQNNVYSSATTAFTFQKPDGATVDITLNAATYTDQPIYLDTIYNEGSKKAGYLVFNSFLGDIENVTNQLTQAFSKFAQAGVTDMIVDLRYNGGGYVSLQQNLADFLVNSSADGQVMMKQRYNDNYASENTQVNFTKLGGLNISNVYFIVSDNTASASELLINNLKPYMNVRLVGEDTYGKPVGFVNLPAGNDWYIFPVSFRSVNALDEGDYFDGLQVDQQANDGLDRDFGDIGESGLSSVITHLRTGAFGVTPRSQGLNSTLDEDIKSVNRKLDPKSFKGMLMSR